MIKASNICKKFEKNEALSNVSCTIEKGCVYGIVGSNGAGKSTFLRVLTGIYKADSGEILVDEENVWDNPAAKSKFVFVPDEVYFIQGANIKRMAALYKTMYENFDMERFNELIQIFKLDKNMSVNSLSKGMKKQLAVILALSSRTEYYFFDETFDGLDPVMRKLVKGLICEEVLERKSTVVITSHSLRELEDMCDHLALLHKGGLIFESEVNNLKTSIFKVQTAFNEEVGKEDFEGIEDIEVLNFSKSGSVIKMIVRGDKEKLTDIISRKNPVIMEIIPLTLEEVFTYEMEALGYEFSDVLK